MGFNSGFKGLKYVHMKRVLRITVNTVQVTDFRSFRMAGNNE